MKLKTEIELWYNVDYDELRIINKLKPNDFQIYHNIVCYKWNRSVFKNKKGIPNEVGLFRKIGEL